MSLGLWEFFWPGPQGSTLATDLPPRGWPSHPAWQWSGLGSNFVLLTSVYDLGFNLWGLPERGPLRNPQDWQRSFLLPLQQSLPKNKSDWANPRGPSRSQQDWVAGSNVALLSGAATQTNPGFNEWAVPNGPPRAQDWIFPSNIALLSGPAQMPCNQYNWPNPRGPQPVPQDFHASFPLPLQQVIQPNQYDWPVPKGWTPLNRGWTDYILPWAQAPPINQIDWPVPRGPRRNPQDWAVSFKLPLQQTLPPRQLDWPNSLAARRNPQDWILPQPYVLNVVVAATPPINQVDWPVPRGASRNDQLLTWVQPGPSYFDVFDPASNDIGNPDGPLPLRFDWIAPSNIALLTAVVTPPPIQQYDWPVPRGSQRNPQDWVLSSSIALLTAPTFDLGFNLWALPERGPLRNPQDWSDSFKLPLQTIVPKNQYNWPNPVLAKRNPQDWIAPSDIALLSAPAATPPIAQHDWPLPRGPRYGNQDWWLAPPQPLQITVTDPAINQMGNPILPIVRRQDWTAGQNLALNVSTTPPINQTDWSNPSRGPQRNPQDWVLSTRPTPTPFFQTDWPNPRGPQRGNQDWKSSFPLPLQQNLPKNQYSWPNPPLAARRNPQDWIYNILPNRQPPPFFQTDWPVPRGPRRGNQDWWLSPPIPLQITVTDPAVNQMGNPILPIVRRPDWIRGTYVALTVQPPIRQRDWPNPRGWPPLNVGWLTITNNPLNPPPPPAGGEMLKNERIRLRFLENQSVSESGRVRWLKNEIRR